MPSHFGWCHFAGPLEIWRSCNVRHTVNFVQFHIKFVKWQAHDLILMVNVTLVIFSSPPSPHSLLSSFSLLCLSSPKKHLDLIWNFCCGYEILFAESGLSSPFSFCHTSENVFPVKFNPKLVQISSQNMPVFYLFLSSLFDWWVYIYLLCSGTMCINHKIISLSLVRWNFHTCVCRCLYSYE